MGNPPFRSSVNVQFRDIEPLTLIALLKKIQSIGVPYDIDISTEFVDVPFDFNEVAVVTPDGPNPVKINRLWTERVRTDNISGHNHDPVVHQTDNLDPWCDTCGLDDEFRNPTVRQR